MTSRVPQDFTEYLALLETMAEEVFDEVDPKVSSIVKSTEEIYFGYVMVIGFFALIAIYVPVT